MSSGLSSYYSLARVIVNTAVQFGNCDCIIKYGDNVGNIRCEGMWSGKTINQWQKGKTHIEKSGFV